MDITSLPLPEMAILLLIGIVDIVVKQMSVNLCMIKTTHLMSKLLKNIRVTTITCQNINCLYIYFRGSMPGSKQ